VAGVEEAAVLAVVSVVVAAAGAAAAVDLVVEVPVEVGSWARKHISSADEKRVSEAVAKAEKGTRGEIVPLIVERSSTIGHVPVTITLFFLVLILIFEVPHHEFFNELANRWLLLLVAGLCFLVAQFLSKISWVQRICIPKGDQKFQVEERAALEFHQLGVQKTQRQTGILLMLSLMERRAVVYGDEGIAKKLSQEAWAQIVEILIEGVKADKTADGMIKAIERSGELLAKHFPSDAENFNELSNQLILKQ
jgi:putative membrane protein